MKSRKSANKQKIQENQMGTLELKSKTKGRNTIDGLKEERIGEPEDGTEKISQSE